MTVMLPAQCLSCTRLDRTPDPALTSTPPRRCTAFPRGIPQEILLGADHRRPRGDEVDGLVYDQDADRAWLFESWRRYDEARRVRT